MIVRNVNDVIGTQDEIRTDTWMSRRVLLKKDGMGFSFHETTIFPGTRTPHPLPQPPGGRVVHRGRRFAGNHRRRQAL